MPGTTFSLFSTSVSFLSSYLASLTLTWVEMNQEIILKESDEADTRQVGIVTSS